MKSRGPLNGKGREPSIVECTRVASHKKRYLRQYKSVLFHL